MNKDVIKLKVREAINALDMIVEAPKSEKIGNAGKKDYADIQRNINKLGGPKMVDVMKLTGIEDDEKGVNRSLFRKKVKQIRNKDTGSIYQFDDVELPKVRAAMDIRK